MRKRKVDYFKILCICILWMLLFLFGFLFVFSFIESDVMLTMCRTNDTLKDRVMSTDISKDEIMSTDIYKDKIMSTGTVAEISSARMNRKEKSEKKYENKTEKRIAITFDDGPHPECTVKLLDGLKQRGIKVSFFVTGANAEKYPGIVKRMADEGHLIGNHTYHHIQLTGTNEEQFREEIVLTNAVIEKIIGKEPEYIRPPYGTWNKNYEKELSMIPVLWTIDPKDWCCDQTEYIVKKVLERVKEDDIILMHDQYASSIEAALQCIDILQDEGYRFVTVDELLLN